MGSRLVALTAAIVGTALFAGAAAAEQLVVTLDQAKIMRVAAPAGTIIIGNPAIADAILQDAQTLVITGRAYGSTNLLVLDSDGEPIADNQLIVQAPTDTVTVYRGPARASLSCAPLCQPTMVPGDSGEAFSTIQSQTASRAGTASGQSFGGQAVAPN